MWKWALTIAGGILAAAGLAVFLVVQGLEKANQWAGVLSLFAALLGLVLAGIGLAGTRGGGQVVEDSTIGGGVTQVRDARGNVRIGRENTPAGPLPQTPPSPPAGGTAPAEKDGQSVRRSWTAGPVRQVDSTGGDVEIDR
jgi:hypothetical protein